MSYWNNARFNRQGYKKPEYPEGYQSRMRNSVSIPVEQKHPQSEYQQQ